KNEAAKSPCPERNIIPPTNNRTVGTFNALAIELLDRNARPPATANSSLGRDGSETICRFPWRTVRTALRCLGSRPIGPRLTGPSRSAPTTWRGLETEGKADIRFHVSAYTQMITIRLTSTEKRKLQKAQEILEKRSARKWSQGEVVAALAEFALRHRILLAQSSEEVKPVSEDNPFYD